MAVSQENGLIDHLLGVLGRDLLEACEPRERRVFLRVKPDAVRRAVQALKGRFETLRFMTLSAVDRGLDIEFLYHFQAGGGVLTIGCIKPKEDNTLDSIVDMVPAADFIEREVSELFGVRLVGHPQPEHGFILTRDWPEDKRPLRRPHEGPLPSEARPVAEALISTGCVASISAYIQRRREEAGLPRLPALAFTDEGALREFQDILRDTNMAERAGFDWKRRRLRYR